MPRGRFPAGRCTGRLRSEAGCPPTFNRPRFSTPSGSRQLGRSSWASESAGLSAAPDTDWRMRERTTSSSATLTCCAKPSCSGRRGAALSARPRKPYPHLSGDLDADETCWARLRRWRATSAATSTSPPGHEPTPSSSGSGTTAPTPVPGGTARHEPPRARPSAGHPCGRTPIQYVVPATLIRKHGLSPLAGDAAHVEADATPDPNAVRSGRQWTTDGHGRAPDLSRSRKGRCCDDLHTSRQRTPRTSASGETGTPSRPTRRLLLGRKATVLPRRRLALHAADPEGLRIRGEGRHARWMAAAARLLATTCRADQAEAVRVTSSSKAPGEVGARPRLPTYPLRASPFSVALATQCL